MTNLVLDLQNFVSVTRHGRIKTPATVRGKERFVTQSIVQFVLSSLSNYAAKLKATGLVVCVDSPDVWRRDVYDRYKRNPDKEIDIYRDEVRAAVVQLIDFFRTQTSAVVLEIPRMEADDLIAVWCRNSTSQNIILSTDKDFVQLIDERNRLYSPTQDAFRECEDPEFYLFVKCVRGDKSDTIPSAYPRIFEKKLLEIWDDPVKMLNFVNTRHENGEVVSDLLSRNMSLIDMDEIPFEYAKEALHSIIKTKVGKFSPISCIKYLSDIGLSDTEMFDRNNRFLSNKPIFQNQ